MREFLAGLRNEDLNRVVGFGNPQASGDPESWVSSCSTPRFTASIIEGRSPCCSGCLATLRGNWDLLFYDAERRGETAW